MIEREAEQLIAALHAYRIKGSDTPEVVEIRGGFMVRLANEITATFLWDGETYDRLICSFRKQTRCGVPFELGARDVNYLQTKLNDFWKS